MTAEDLPETPATDLMTRVAHRLVDLADTIVDDFDVVELLDRLVSDCVDLLSVSAAAILLRNDSGILDVVASSDEASRLMEVFQLDAEGGPCIDAVTSGEPVLIRDPAELGTRWPAFAEAVARVGFSSVYAIPLRLRSETIGALNLFNSPDNVTEYDYRLARALADMATIGILQQRSVSLASLMAEQLQLTLNTRITVEQAKGVISEYGSVDVGTAFVAIRRYARENGRNLSDVAKRLVDRQLHPSDVIPAGERA